MSRNNKSVPTLVPSDNGKPEEQFPFGANVPAETEAIVSRLPAVTDALDVGQAAPDPFDPASLRLTQDFSTGSGVKKVHLTVPVRKPEKTWFVRAHPDETYRLQTAVIELKEERGEIYAVAPALWQELASEVAFRPKLLVTAINRQGVVFLWALNLPKPDGKVDEWTRTGLEAVQLATKGWIHVYANMGVGGYEVAQPSANLSEPVWPDLPFRELLRIAFRERFVDSLDHPILRRLRGEV
jgi:hypothetical protein